MTGKSDTTDFSNDNHINFYFMTLKRPQAQN